MVSIRIPIRPDRALFRQVYDGLRAAILDARALPGERLPSTRALAEHLAVSRTVVLLAYEQLLAEGYLVARGGSGTYVSSAVSGRTADRSEQPIRLSRFGQAVSRAGEGLDFPPRRAGRKRFDFAYGRANIADFPFERWRRLIAKHAQRTSIRALDYAPAAGDDGLREAIAAHLRRSRGVVCDPWQVIVVSGSQQALDLIARVLIDPGDPVAIEDPQYQGTREVLRAAGAVLQPVPVDAAGLDPARLPQLARALFVTPSHQFPTGAVLPLGRRLALLEWAAGAGAVIVEDDYDGEFRYDGQPLESLQGLDTRGCVIYVGTFSRTVFPALRIGYLVVPRALAASFSAAKWLCDRHTASLEQRVLAEFISSGAYELYLRRLRRRNAARRDALLAAIARRFGGIERVSGAAAGAHVAFWLDGLGSEAHAIEAAAAADVGVYGLSDYFIGEPRAGLLLGYAQLDVAEITEGIERLTTQLKKLGAR